MTMTKIYVASSWRNAYQPQVVEALRKAGHDVYDFRNPPSRKGFAWSDIDQNWQNWSTEEYVNALGNPIAKEGFQSDFNAMQESDVCVLVLPCGRSANAEAGWMKGAGKKVYVLQKQKEEPELMYKMFDGVFSDEKEIIKELVYIEDTKIRKEIKNYIEKTLVDCKFSDKGVAWIAWLEKQKPVEWSQEDLICLGYLADFVDKNGDDFYGKNKPNVVKWIRSFAELPTHTPIKEIEQKPVEWSREDETMLNYMQGHLQYLQNSKDYSSSEDQMLLKKQMDWLKSLRPPYYCDSCKLKKSIQSWKPSVMHMNALEQVIKKYLL